MGVAGWLWMVGTWVTPAQAAEPGLPGRADLAAQLPAVERVLPWSEVGFLPASAESKALGPDRVTVSPDGQIAWFNSAIHEVQLLDGLVYPLARCDGLLFLDDDTLVSLDDAGRTLTLLDLDGSTSQTPLPRMVPPGGTLALDDNTLLSVDAFGNGHAVARWDGVGLRAPTGPRLVAPRHTVVSTRIGAETRLSVDGAVVATSPHRTGGRVLGDWLIVEERTPDATIRTAISLKDGARHRLPTARLYAPTVDLAGGDGKLVLLMPAADGLHIREVAP